MSSQWWLGSDVTYWMEEAELIFIIFSCCQLLSMFENCISIFGLNGDFCMYSFALLEKEYTKDEICEPLKV